MGKTINILMAVIALLMMASFTLGLAHGISTGFAGFWGGLPFWIILLAVFSCAAYDAWDSIIRDKD